MKLPNTAANNTNQDATRETAILQNLNLVKDIGKRFQGRVPPCITLDDLISVRNPVDGDHDSGAKPISIPAASRSPIPEPSRSVIPV